uniref:E3 ubiquitin-protein ligase RGLG n=1 Tax=Tetraselmis sp. GSL018 TaxID=582737 RepID=A0A061S259_9CHLO|mmetsp:Transcript_21880/g.52283  ORF Transcript_21880/g.52283 Transcript_21880/m.52283 type:complete len:345 (+) Transcript_21880:344-1378(+)
MGTGVSISGGVTRLKGSAKRLLSQRNTRDFAADHNKAHEHQNYDKYTSLLEVQQALREKGLHSCNLILGIDFTKSNDWTGKICFDGRSLHNLNSGHPNPYQTAVSAIARTLEPFDEDKLIPCYGFGDSVTQDGAVFSFHKNDEPCRGLDNVLSRYSELVPKVRTAGPTSFAPIIRKATEIVSQSHGGFHILVIIADGQVTRPVDLPPQELSRQEKETMSAIVDASEFPLSIVLVGVGDGPWDKMQEFDDALPQRKFDNFQFVNFTSIARTYGDVEKRNAVFALAALMEIPPQYEWAKQHGLIGARLSVDRKRTEGLVHDPPTEYAKGRHSFQSDVPSRSNTSCS